MEHLRLIPIDEELAAALKQGSDAFEAQYEALPGSHFDVICEVVDQTLSFIGSAPALPWVGYLAIAQDTHEVRGTCAFKGAPDAEGCVEIAYFTFPGYEGRGNAVAMASGLLRIALASPLVTTVFALTLPERNASTRVLEKSGFIFVGEVQDPEDGLLWRWQIERKPHLTRTAP
jgi:RimJ/RimL family protein N-acetyltransferase